MQRENYYTISEAAKVLNISISTLKRWEKKGHVKAIRTKEGYRLFGKKQIDIHYAAYNQELKEARMTAEYKADMAASALDDDWAGLNSLERDGILNNTRSEEIERILLTGLVSEEYEQISDF